MFKTVTKIPQFKFFPLNDFLFNLIISACYGHQFGPKGYGFGGGSGVLTHTS